MSRNALNPLDWLLHTQETADDTFKPQFLKNKTEDFKDLETLENKFRSGNYRDVSEKNVTKLMDEYNRIKDRCNTYTISSSDKNICLERLKLVEVEINQIKDRLAEINKEYELVKLNPSADNTKYLENGVEKDFTSTEYFKIDRNIDKDNKIMKVELTSIGKLIKIREYRTQDDFTNTVYIFNNGSKEGAYDINEYYKKKSTESVGGRRRKQIKKSKKHNKSKRSRVSMKSRRRK